MKYFVTLFFLLGAAGSSVAQNWTRQDSLQPHALHSVSFIDTSCGWAVGHWGTILKTTDGGGSWLVHTTGTENDEFSSSFVDTCHGWTTSVAGIVRRTTNGGQSWTTQTTNTTEWLRDIIFLNVNRGWTVGQGGTILRTVNGGTTWTQQPTGAWRNINTVTFTDSLHGWAAGSGMVFKTTNGGTTWTNQTNINWLALYAITFVDTLHGWIVGDDGQILQTVNGGTSWTIQNSGTTNVLHGVAFVDTLCGWAVGDGGVIRQTADGGRTWIPQASGTTNHLESITFADANHGWAVGTNGTILHYHGTPALPEPPDPFPLNLPLDGAVIDTAAVELSWFRSHDADPGSVPHYDVWLDTLSNLGSAWMVADSIADTSVTVDGLRNDHSYYWTVRATDDNTAGTWADDTLSFRVDIPSGTGIPDAVTPGDYYILTSYPSPFNPATIIAFALPKAEHVSLRVFDLLGREVAVLKDGVVEAGSHHVLFDGRTLASGIYFAKLEAGTCSQARKLVLQK